ncbi:hypothetical protein BGW41_005654 [Actinomortierella wolfii]|nr:hypothetical protein BGW41_005654 [Actinomortierella wolfii]
MEAIRLKRLNWETKLLITQQLIRGVAYMHSNGVLHCDIKSDNVLLTDGFRVAKLCDFGLAKLNRKPLTGIAAEIHVGTPLWKAPELFVEDPKYTKKTDVYSLGWVIWQMATNSIRPFEGTDVNKAIEQIKKGYRGDVPDGTPEEMRKPIESFWDHKASRRLEASSFIAQGTWINEVEDDSFETIEISAVTSYEEDFGQQDETLVADTTYSLAAGSSNRKYPKHSLSISPTTRHNVLQSISTHDINQDTTAATVSTKQENATQGLDVSHLQLPSVLHHQQLSLTTAKPSEPPESSPSVEEQPVKVRVINIRRQALADNIGTLQNDFEALFWFRKAAERGHPEAQFRIGYMHEHNKMLAKDINRAMHWYGKAANQGHQEAMRRLLALFPPRTTCVGKSDTSSDSDDSHDSDSDDPNSGSGTIGIPYHEVAAEVSGRVQTSQSMQPDSTSLVLDTVIKEGDIGVVYRARYINIPCIAKRLHISPQQFQHSAIQDEVALVQRLRHLHLIQFYEAYEHEGHVYFIMELAEKGSLSDVITSDEPLDWPTKTQIANQITRGIEYLHYNDVLHGFLKSSNVILTESMKPKLSDFGLPAVRSAASSSTSSFTFPLASIKNFVRWMAPELIYTSPHYSTKSDVYSLGMVLWEMASNSIKPFEDIDNETNVILHLQQGGRENLPAETPRGYRLWVERCWENDPINRPEAGEIIFAEDDHEVVEPEASSSKGKSSSSIRDQDATKTTELVTTPLVDTTESLKKKDTMYLVRGDEGCVMELNKALQHDWKPLALLGQDVQKPESQYTKSLKADEVMEALNMYIAPQCTLRSDATELFDLEEMVDSFLASNEKKVLLLLGEEGSGKSTFSRFMAQRLWVEYTSSERHVDRPIPLFIPLTSLDNPGGNLIEQYLKKQDLSEAQIETLQAERRFIFILDGYDEIAHSSQAFYAKNNLDLWQAQVIISSRPEYLGANYQHQFYPPGSPSRLEECWLAGFSDEQIDHYIDKFVKHAQQQWSAQRYRQTFEVLGKFKELVRTPFMLRMTLEALSELKAKSDRLKPTRIGLYEKFVAHWLNRSQERLANIQLNLREKEVFEELEVEFARHGWGYCQELALAMYERHLVSVVYSEASDGKSSDWRAGYLGDAKEETRLLRFNAPLVRQGNQYRFIHKSIQDYLVARAIWVSLENPVQPSRDVAPSNWIRNIYLLWQGPELFVRLDRYALLNRFNLVEDAAIQRFLVERVEQNNSLVKPLLAWIKSSKTDELVSQGRANAITILARAGVQFIDSSLMSIRIPGTDLGFGPMESAQLHGAALGRTQFRRANLGGAQMAKVQLGKRAHLVGESAVHSCAYSPNGKACAMGLDNGQISIHETSNWASIRTLYGHKASVRSVAYSPNGTQIASGSWDRTVRLWNTRSGVLQHILRGHEAHVLSVAYSPDGAQIISGSQDKTVRLWDARSGALQYILRGHESSVHSVAYSPDGAKIASESGDMTVRLWDASSGALQHTLRGHEDWVSSVVYAPNGEQIASGTYGTTVRLWDAKSGALQHTLRGHEAHVYSVAYSSNGAQIASCSHDMTLRLWDTKNGALQHTLRSHTSYVYSVAYSPDGAQIASGSEDKTVRLWDARSGVLRHTLRSFEPIVHSAMHSLHSAITSSTQHNMVRLWKTKSDALQHPLRGHESSVHSVAYSPDGEKIASGSRDNTVRLWDARSGALLHILQGHESPVYSVAYSPDGAQIASSSEDKTVRLWDVVSGSLQHILRGHESHVHSVAYLPSGGQIASGSNDKTVRVWDAKSGALQHILRGHKHSVWSVAYSPNDAQIASGSEDMTVRLWDAKKGTLEHILRGHKCSVSSVAYSPNGEQIASGSEDMTVRLWHVVSGALEHTLRGHESYVYSVAYSPNGARIASASGDNTVRLWDAASGQCRVVIRDFNGMVSSVAWKATPEKGDDLVTGCEDTFVRRWRVIVKENDVKVDLRWKSPPAELGVKETLIKGVGELSKQNPAQLKRRGNSDGAVLSDLT